MNNQNTLYNNNHPSGNGNGAGNFVSSNNDFSLQQQQQQQQLHSLPQNMPLPMISVAENNSYHTSISSNDNNGKLPGPRSFTNLMNPQQMQFPNMMSLPQINHQVPILTTTNLQSNNTQISNNSNNNRSSSSSGSGSIPAIWQENSINIPGSNISPFQQHTGQIQNSNVNVKNEFDTTQDSLTGSTSPTEDTNNKVRKRNKLSFNCVCCRKRKSKCDHLKPKCTNCIKLNTQCVYDTDTQVAPKRPNKDAVIARLSKQVEYWKNKALKETFGSSVVRSDDLVDQESQKVNKDSKKNTTDSDNESHAQESHTSTVQSLFGNTLTYRPAEDELSTLTINPEHIYIDFKTQAPSLVITNGVTKSLDIFSDIGVIQKDIFLRMLMASTLGFAKKTQQPHTTIKSIQNAVQKTMVAKIDRDFQPNDSEKEVAKQYLEKIIFGKSLGHLATQDLQISLLNTFTSGNESSVENSIVQGEQRSVLLNTCVAMLEKVLPPKATINSYKNFFYAKLYPSMAFLDIPTFENILQEVFVDDLQRPGFYKIQIGTSNIRAKLENLVLLCILLKISDIGIQSVLLQEKNAEFSNNEMLNSKLPIDADLLPVSIKVLVYLKVFVWTTENSLCCLMYLWICIAVAPEETTMFARKPTDLMVNIITTLACNTGLDKDPMELDYFKKHNEPTKVNFRRKLNIHLTSMVLVENLFKGKLYLHDNEKILSVKYQQYLSMMIETEPGMSNLEKKILSLCFRRAQLYAYIGELFYHSRKDSTFSLAAVEASILKIEGFVEKNFMLSNLKKPTLNSEEFLPGCNTKVSSTQVENTYCIELVLFTKCHTLMVNNSVFISLQNSSKDAKLTKEYFPFFKKYFIVLIHEVCVSFKLLEDFFNGEFDYALNYTQSLTMMKSVIILSNRVLFALLSLLIRFEFSKHILSKRLSKRLDNIFNSREIQVRLDLLSKMSVQTTAILARLCDCLSKKYRFAYFQSFKTLMYFDYIRQIIKEGQLCNVLLRFLNKKNADVEPEAGVFEVLKCGMSFDIEHSDEFLEELERSELLSFVPIALLEEYLNTLVITEVISLADMQAESPEEPGMPNTSNKDEAASKVADILNELDSTNIFNYDFLFSC